MGQTPDISIFRFPWFSAVWYYDPQVSFPVDRMRPGFFLKLAENTGDGFAYVILPALEYKDIPRTRNPTTLVRCVVRKRDISSHVAPRCKRVNGEFKFSNHKGDELIGDDELKSDAEIAAMEEIPDNEPVNDHHAHSSVDHPQQP